MSLVSVRPLQGTHHAGCSLGVWLCLSWCLPHLVFVSAGVCLSWCVTLLDMLAGQGEARQVHRPAEGRAEEGLCRTGQKVDPALPRGRLPQEQEGS